MDGEIAKRNIYLAATRGEEIATFTQLLQEYPYILDEVSFACSRNVLHIAVMYRQDPVVGLVLDINPLLAQNLDSQGSSPLHIAAAKGSLPIVQRLLWIAPEMCWLRDCHGMNPVHIAAVNGHVNLLEVLIDRDPFPAAEKLERGQTVLHLCVKHRRIEALRYLVETLGELVDVEDDDGETVLHSAVRFKRVEVVKFLVGYYTTYELPTNSKGKTVHQICRETSPYDDTSAEIDRILSRRLNFAGKPSNFQGRMSEVIMVVVILIATMAFQAAVSPPGGVWQGGSSPSHMAGEAVMASTRPKIFRNFRQANAAAFFSSSITIMLLTTGLPSRNILFTMVVTCAMWISLASIGISYVASAIVMTPDTETRSIHHFIYITVAIFVGIYGIFCYFARAAIASTVKPYWMAHRWRQRQAARPFRHQPESRFAAPRPVGP